MAEIALSHLSKRFGTQTVVADLTLDVRDGEFVTLLGPSGCGKTTILRLLAGFLRPDGGEIRVDGTPLSTPRGVVPPERRRMGMVFQTYALWPHMTVWENVAFGLSVQRRSRAEVRDRVDRVLALVGLSGLEGRHPALLSGGQQQRVALARSLITQPSILLLDEPLSNLDAKLRERMRTELRDLHNRTGITFLYVTHDQAEAMALSDRVAVLSGGVLQQYGTARDVYERPANKFVADFMGAVNALAGVVAAPAGETGEGVVILAAGASITAALPSAAAAGSPITVTIRPEDVRLSAERPAGARNVLHGTVIAQVFLGNLVDYHVDVGGAILHALAPRQQTFPAGAQVYLSIEPGRCLGMAS
jgi:iron(III) transport system ATP-binding protein